MTFAIFHTDTHLIPTLNHKVHIHLRNAHEIYFNPNKWPIKIIKITHSPNLMYIPFLYPHATKFCQQIILNWHNILTKLYSTRALNYIIYYMDPWNAFLCVIKHNTKSSRMHCASPVNAYIVYKHIYYKNTHTHGRITDRYLRNFVDDHIIDPVWIGVYFSLFRFSKIVTARWTWIRMQFACIWMWMCACLRASHTLR